MPTFFLNDYEKLRHTLDLKTVIGLIGGSQSGTFRLPGNVYQSLDTFLLSHLEGATGDL